MNKNEFQLKNISVEIQITFKEFKPKSVNLQISSKDSYESIYKIINPNIPIYNENGVWKYDLRTIYCFQKFQTYRIDVSRDENISVGSIQFQLGELLQQRNLIKNTNYFTVQFSVQLLQKGVNIFWQWAGEKLLNTDGIFSKSDPFLKFYMWDDGQWNQVYETEYIDNNLNPVWIPFTIDMGCLNYYDESKNFKIECWDYSHKNPQKNKFIGILEISYTEIQASPDKKFQLSNPDHQKCGQLKVLSSQISEKQNFLSFISHTQIQTLIFIEFSKETANLHSKSHQQLNIFQQFIMYFGSLLSQYNKQNAITLQGFGGLIPNNKKEMFLISKGENGMLQVYQDYAKILKDVQFGDRFELTPALFEIIKQTEIFKPNFTIGMVFMIGHVTDEEKIKLFLSHQINLPTIMILIILSEVQRNIFNLINSYENLNKVKIFHLSEFDAKSVQAMKEKIMIVIENELKKYYNIE